MNDNYRRISAAVAAAGATLVAVSKTKPVDAIREMYDAGQRDFGENKVQEMQEKAPQLPDDIRWHLIGHLQRNKVKYIASYVHMIHAVDSPELLAEIDKQAARVNRVIPVLLQVHIAEEETKFGFDAEELRAFLGDRPVYQNVRISGLMGMATFTDDMTQVRKEFHGLKLLFDELKQTYFAGDEHFMHLSMGMSSDYEIALEEGSTLVRIGTLLFGAR